MLLAEFVARTPVATCFPRWRLKTLLKDAMVDSRLPDPAVRDDVGYST
jgi:hypothetical protein